MDHRMEQPEMLEKYTAGSLKNVEKIDQKIDAFIRTNPQLWAKAQALPRERLERSYILRIMTRLQGLQKRRENEAKKWLKEQPIEEVMAKIADKNNWLSNQGASYAKPLESMG